MNNANKAQTAPRTRKARDPSDTRAIVEVRDVHQAFGAIEVLKGVSFSVPKSGVVFIIGPS